MLRHLLYYPLADPFGESVDSGCEELHISEKFCLLSTVSGPQISSGPQSSLHIVWQAHVDTSYKIRLFCGTHTLAGKTEMQASPDKPGSVQRCAR